MARRLTYGLVAALALTTLMEGSTHASWVNVTSDPAECPSGFELVVIEMGGKSVTACVPQEKTDPKLDESSKQNEEKDGPQEGPHFN